MGNNLCCCGKDIYKAVFGKKHQQQKSQSAQNDENQPLKDDQQQSDQQYSNTNEEYQTDSLQQRNSESVKSIQYQTDIQSQGGFSTSTKDQQISNNDEQDDLENELKDHLNQLEKQGTNAKLNNQNQVVINISQQNPDTQNHHQPQLKKSSDEENKQDLPQMVSQNIQIQIQSSQEVVKQPLIISDIDQITEVVISDQLLEHLQQKAQQMTEELIYNIESQTEQQLQLFEAYTEKNLDHKLKMYIKSYDSAKDKIIVIKYTWQINQSIEKVVQFFSSVAAQKEVDQYVDKYQDLKTYSDNLTLFYICYKKILFFSKARDFTYIRKITKISDDKYVLSSKSVDIESLPRFEKKERGEILLAGSIFKKIDENNTSITTFSECNSKISIPLIITRLPAVNSIKTYVNKCYEYINQQNPHQAQQQEQ